MSNTEPGADALTDLVTPVVIRVAVALGLLERARTAPAPVPVLAEQLGVDPGVLARLVRFLQVRDVLTVDTDGAVHTADLGRALVDTAGDEAARLNWLGAGGRLDRMFVAGLMSAVRGDHATGDLWRLLDGDAEFARSFDALMGARMPEWAGPVVAAPWWRTVGRVADVGGGRGDLLLALLAAWPHLRGTLVERPGPAAAADATARAAGLAGRIDVVVADARETVPPGSDVYVLAHVLHDWDDDIATAFLTSTARAAGRAGRVVVVERDLADGEADRRMRLEATAQDLRMLALLGGRERTAAELDALAAGAGLTRRRRDRLTGCRSMFTYGSTLTRGPTFTSGSTFIRGSKATTPSRATARRAQPRSLSDATNRMRSHHD